MKRVRGMVKKQFIAVSLVSLLLGVWFTVASLFMTLNYVDEREDLNKLKFGLPFYYLTQDCESFDQEELPTTLSICDPQKYPIYISPLRLIADLVINIGAPFGIISVIVLFGNARYVKKHPEEFE